MHAVMNAMQIKMYEENNRRADKMYEDNNRRADDLAKQSEAMKKQSKDMTEKISNISETSLALQQEIRDIKLNTTMSSTQAKEFGPKLPEPLQAGTNAGEHVIAATKEELPDSSPEENLTVRCDGQNH